MEIDLWLEMLETKNFQIRLETLKYLTARAYGPIVKEVKHKVEHTMTLDQGRKLARQMLMVDGEVKEDAKDAAEAVEGEVIDAEVKVLTDGSK
jgi:hypothetical protein